MATLISLKFVMSAVLIIHALCARTHAFSAVGLSFVLCSAVRKASGHFQNGPIFEKYMIVILARLVGLQEAARQLLCLIVKLHD